MNNQQILVTKRSGDKEELDINKLHKMVEMACEDLTGVSPSQVEMNSQLQFFDGITTQEIQNILIRSASDLISLENPNYQYVASRLVLFSVYKEIFGSNEPLPFRTIIDRNVKREIYDADILNKYSDEEIEILGSYIKHARDYNFAFAGLQQLVDKYLIKNKGTNELYETPQIMYMMIAATLFSEYDPATRLQYVKKYYDQISLFKINIPTPILTGVRTKVRQYSSCVLIDVGDTLDSIFSSNTAVGKYTSQKAGIGLNLSRVRAIKSPIRNGEVQHTGVIPFLKMFQATVKSCQQGGTRGGGGTVNFPIWHAEIEDIIVLKNNKGTDENRVRNLDYVIQISKLFYERLISNKHITLFSPSDVPGLYEAFASSDQEEFQRLYEKYENSRIRKKIIPARELFSNILQERLETGRIYIMNIDHFNTHSSFDIPVSMTNLCVEISLPTTPIDHIDDDKGEISVCILSAINIGKLKSLDDLESICEMSVRALEALIDYQNYPVTAAEIATRARRNLGIGYTGLAHYLARKKVKYSDPEAAQLIHDLSEAFQYYLLKASNKLAMEKGPCERFEDTKYAKGILPIDTYKKDFDDVVPNKLNYDWEKLRKDIKEHGLRHSTLSAQMPCESSSLISNETNGIEPPRGLMSVKKSNLGVLPQIVPGYPNLKNNYTLLWDMPTNEGYFNIVGAMQKFFDQSISANWNYNPSNYENNEVPMSVLMNDMLTAYKLGHKTAYYNQTFDGKNDDDIKDEEACDSCAI